MLDRNEQTYKPLPVQILEKVFELADRVRNLEGGTPSYDVNNENSPTQITADQNDYAPGDYDVLRLSTDASRAITGLSGGVKGRRLLLINVGAFNFTLPHQSGSSAIANRIITKSGATVTVAPNGSAELYYDSTTLRWREI